MEKKLTGRKILWMLIAFFLTVAAINAYMITRALKTMPAVEAKSSYQASLSYADEIKAAAAQDALGWHVDLRHEESAATTWMHLKVQDKAGTPLTLKLAQLIVSRPADGTELYRGIMQKVSDGQYEVQIVPSLAPGQWRFQVTLEGQAGEKFRSDNKLVIP